MSAQEKSLLDRGVHHYSSDSNNHKQQQRSLPWSLLPNDDDDDRTIQLCAAADNRPLWICDRLAQEVTAVPYTENYTNREREKFLSKIASLSESVGKCERIQTFQAPLHYARHSLRALTLWLFTLPLALSGQYAWWTAALCQGITAWLLYGIYQIGYKIEDPFQGSLRLSTLCDGIYRNVRMERRASAFEVTVGDPREEYKGLPLVG